MRKPFTPRPYQGMIVEHILTNPRCAIWAGMGLGKTVAALTAVDGLFLSGVEPPALVLGPLRVVASTWPEEAAKWHHLKDLGVRPIVGTPKERKLALRADANVFAINYDNLPWLIDYYGDRWPFKIVIADESTRLKGFRLRQGGKRAQALASVAHSKISYFFNLTGTPAPNGLADLWGQTWFLDAGNRLGRTYDAFRQRWFQKSFDGYGTEPLPYAQEQIQAKLHDICLTVDPADWFDLEKPIINDIYIELPQAARALYRDMERRMFMELAGHPIEAVNAAARTLKCLQIANGAAYIDDKQNWKEIHDQKIQALEDVVEEASGAPVLVAYHFKSDLVRLLKSFPQGRVLDANPDTLREWNSGQIPVLFAHPASAGHGLNLQDGGNILVYFGHWWNLEERMQILERIGPVRQLQAGYKRPVFVHNIIARDTMDDLVIERVNTKRSVQDILLAAMKRQKGVR